MPTRYEYFTSPVNGSGQIYSNYWRAQSFTPQVAHTSTSVKLYCYRVGTITGDFIVSIKATDGNGHPTGSDLCSCTVLAGNLPTSETWVEFAFDPGYNLDASTKYAIVARAPSGNAAKYVIWRHYLTGGYGGGQCLTSSDSGSSWAGQSSDQLFEDWGEPLAGSITKVADETVNLVESLITAAWRSLRFVVDTVGLNEGLLRRGWTLRFVPETTSLLEGVVRKGATNRFVSSTISIAEDFVKSTFSTITQIADETVTLLEGLLRRAYGIYLVTSTISLASAFVRRAWSSYFVSSNVSLDDTPIRRAWFSRVADEAISLIAGAVLWLSGGPVIKVANETVNVIEGIVRRAWSIYLWGTTVAITESIIRKGMLLPRIFDESIGLTEVIVRRAYSNYFIQSTMALGESLLRRGWVICLTIENAAIIETLTRRLRAIYLIGESLTILDLMVARIWFTKVASETVGLISSQVYKTWMFIPEVLTSIKLKLQRRFAIYRRSQ